LLITIFLSSCSLKDSTTSSSTSDSTDSTTTTLITASQTSFDVTDGNSFTTSFQLHSTVQSLSVSPSLPSGISLDQTTGSVSGTWAGSLGSNSYTFTATSASGTSQTVSISVSVAPWLPSNSSQLKIWLKADTGVYSNTSGTTVANNGDTIMSWRDQSGNGNHFINTNSHKPALITSGLNNLPSVAMSGDTSGGVAAAMCLSPGLSSCSQLFNADRTIYTVSSVDVNTDYWQNLYSTRDSGYTGSTQTALTIGGPGVTTASMTWFADNASDTFSIYPSNTMTLGQKFMSEHYSPVTNQKILYLGGALNHWIPLNGKMSEFILFQGSLTSDEKAKIRRYLQWKYNIP
jgi:hypothetical protein